jgi:hypothetical protein
MTTANPTLPLYGVAQIRLNSPPRTLQGSRWQPRAPLLPTTGLRRPASTASPERCRGREDNRESLFAPLRGCADPPQQPAPNAAGVEIATANPTLPLYGVAQPRLNSPPRTLQGAR